MVGGGGGGSAGGTNYAGGGFTSGAGEYTQAAGGINGLTLAAVYDGFATRNKSDYTEEQIIAIQTNFLSNSSYPGIGGAYFEAYDNKVSGYVQGIDLERQFAVCGCVGGGLCSGRPRKETTLAGGYGGKGGNVTVSSNAQINSYNGSYITEYNITSDSDKQSSQCPIYGQIGYDIDAIGRNLKIKSVASRTTQDLINEFSSYTLYRTLNYSGVNDPFTSYGKIGIGSGAGSKEISNGTYIVN